MRKLLGLAVVIVAALVLALPYSQGQDKDKKAQSILIEVTAADIAKEFAKDRDAATKKYDPNPPKKRAAGGAIIKISGELEKAKGMDLFLKTDSPIKVLIKAKKLVGEATGKKAVEVDGGTFKEFKDKTIVIEAATAKLVQIVGKEKN